eukprot:m51a1_g8257 hypothetical protein (322) ;mRNA; f:173559-174775
MYHGHMHRDMFESDPRCGAQPAPVLRWVRVAGGSAIPANAVVGGNEEDGARLFVARTELYGSLIPGKAAPHFNGVNVAFDGREETITGQYEVLVAEGSALPPQWQRVEPGQHLTFGAAGRDVGGEPLWVARTPYRNGMHVGKAGNHIGGISISWGGQEVILRGVPYEVLNVPPEKLMHWVPVNGGDVPQGAVQGGSDAGSPLYVARAAHDGALTPGKALPAHACMYVPFGGQEVRYTSYEVLVLEPNAPQPRWVTVAPGQRIPDSGAAGHDIGGEPLWVARIPFEGGLCIGKAGNHLHGITVPYGGKEHHITSQPFEVLLV